MTLRIDLNADLGESFGAWVVGDDEAMLEVVTSANVACGFHAGDASTIRRTVAAAGRHRPNGRAEALAALPPNRHREPVTAPRVVVEEACTEGRFPFHEKHVEAPVVIRIEGRARDPVLGRSEASW